MTPACIATVGEQQGDDATCTEGKCDGKGGGVCTDQRYGDGTCDTELECAAPDIDCFVTFDDDEAAATWYGALEGDVAESEGRDPYPLIGQSDKRFVRMRKLLDRGWRAFRDNRAVGDLYGLRPALVIVDDPSINAFVISDFKDTMNAGFAVMLNSGLVDANSPDDQVLGVMMHEFQHAIGLHVIAGVDERVRKFYVAPSSVIEPIGNRVAEDPTAREYGVLWRQYAQEVGPYSHAQLGGLPVHGGEVERVFAAAIQQASAANPAACQNAKQQLDSVGMKLMEMFAPLSKELPPDLGSVAPAITSGLATLRNECMAGFTADFIDVLAELAGVPRATIEPQFSAEDRALVAGKHVVDGVTAVIKDRRSKMRAAEAAFSQATGRPWSALRYFSTEEDADDVTVPVLRAAGLNPTGAADFFFSAFEPSDASRCQSLLASGQVPPYGVDLLDEHHGECWRAFHIHQVADQAGSKRAPVRTARAVDDLPPRIPSVKRPGDYRKY
ncbi:MAG: M48 family metalloprotease [Kofleriaceae bacterium]